MSASSNLNIAFPVQGWRQFLSGRKQMLDAFDRAKEKAKANKIGVLHGRVGEAEFRKWLAEFLPKRYEVTSGFIISQGVKAPERAPHFDVIIYDHLESPVLWVNPDNSSQGRSLAIPVEYVRCVIEVKSTFSSTSVSEALEHLKELLPLMNGQDAPEERYKRHLPAQFVCGIVFFDLPKSNQYSEKSLAKLIYGAQLRGFFGGLILRAEGHPAPEPGRLSLMHSPTPIASTIGAGKSSLLSFGMCQSMQVGDNLHFSSMLIWSEPAFSQFAFDLLAMMQGTYQVGRLSSFYGMGTSQWDPS